MNTPIMDLVMLEEGDNYHFALIRNFSSFLSIQSGHKTKRHV